MLVQIHESFCGIVVLQKNQGKHTQVRGGDTLPALLPSKAYHVLPNDLITYPVIIFPSSPFFNIPVPNTLYFPFWFVSFLFFSESPIPAGTREVGGLDLLLVYVDETTNNCDPASDNK